MAFPDSLTISHPGEKQGGSTDPYELFLKEFSGLVLTEFMAANDLSGRVQKRMLRGAKSAQFPVIGGVSGGYFTPGTNILDEGITPPHIQSVPHTEKIIYADKKLLTTVLVDDWEEMLNHYDFRAPYAAEMGEYLGRQMDLNVLKNLGKAAAASANLTGGFGGSRIDIETLPSGTGNGEADGDTMAAAIKQAAITLDSKRVPKRGRWAVVSPTAFYNLIAQNDVIDVDYTGGMANGDRAKGVLKQLYGINILSNELVGSTAEWRINHTSTANQLTGGTEGNDYTFDAQTNRGFVFQDQALGAVVTQDLTVESEYNMQYQGQHLVAKIVMGMGILRPECVVELYDAA